MFMMIFVLVDEITYYKNVLWEGFSHFGEV